ncbi:hypothetical protein F4561_005410 [Lipingzhangella halophila]|uniref:Uncharacterized protein n=1 Tax=Lipingzhangella halophila TaxID=1783352 RepID=A0A7W7W679_9ACTN|nr:hypothetical protein [Lipingzhangella halophila]MBB4934590.1 hypothetical protein [Lipingzhangella halophila]
MTKNEDRVREWIVKKVREVGTVKLYRLITAMNSRDRHLFKPALEAAVKDGRLTMVGKTVMAGDSVHALGRDLHVESVGEYIVTRRNGEVASVDGWGYHFEKQAGVIAVFHSPQLLYIPDSDMRSIEQNLTGVCGSLIAQEVSVLLKSDWS